MKIKIGECLSAVNRTACNNIPMQSTDTLIEYNRVLNKQGAVVVLAGLFLLAASIFVVGALENPSRASIGQDQSSDNTSSFMIR